MDITIRRMRSGDGDELYRLLSDPMVMRYLEPPYDRVQTEAFLHDAGLSEPPLVYAVQKDERFIGYVIYHDRCGQYGNRLGTVSGVLGARLRVGADGSAH